MLYNIAASETVYYRSEKIEADSLEQAFEKYKLLIHDGDIIEISHSEGIELFLAYDKDIDHTKY